MSATITAPLAAVTTIFTPPCPVTWLLTSTEEPSQYPTFPTTAVPTCDPPAWPTNIADKGFQYYSPGICPSGFEVGPSCQITKTRTDEGFPSVRTGETAVYCVPSGQSCTTDTTDFRGGVWGATNDGRKAFTVGPAVQIRFQQSDLSLFETHPLTPGLTLSAGGPLGTSFTAVAVASLSSTTAGNVGPTTGAAASSTTAPEVTTVASSSSTTAGNVEPTTGAAASSTTAPEVTTVASLSSTTAGNVGPTTGAAASSSTAPEVTTVATISDGIPMTTTYAVSPNSSTSQSSNVNDSVAGLESEASLREGLIAVVVLTITATMAAIIFVIYRTKCFNNSHWWCGRSRRRQTIIPVGLGAWIGPPISNGEDPGCTNQASAPQIGSIDLQTSLISSSIFSQIDPPLGSKLNPAELEADQRCSQRASWVSRMLSRAARSSTSTDLSLQSRWTRRSLTVSGDWEAFVNEKTGRALREPDLPTRPEASQATRSRPITETSLSSDNGRSSRIPVPLMSLPKVRSFDRLSEGTFGRVVVRGRSPDPASRFSNFSRSARVSSSNGPSRSSC